MENRIQIGPHWIGGREPVFIIAEVGSNHNGSLEQAKKLIDICVKTKVDAVKFQAFKAGKLFNKIKNKGIVDKLKKLEIKNGWYEKLFDYANKRGLIFLSSVFDEGSVDLLDNLGIVAYKVASYELTHIPLLEHIAKKNKPIILSTGMANRLEIKEAIRSIHKAGNKQIIILHCISQYPTKSEDVNLNSLLTLQNDFNCPIGFSDHTKTIYASIGAVALGAKVIEKHFTLDRSLPGSDHYYALEPNGLKQMVIAIREVEKMLGSGEIRPATSEIQERGWRRTIYAICDIPKGAIIIRDMVAILRPSPKGSLNPKYLKRLLGKKIGRGIKREGYFLEGDIQ